MTSTNTASRGTIITTGTGAGLGTSIALQLIASSGSDVHNIFTVRPSQDTSSPTYHSLQQAISTSAKPSNNEILHLSMDDLSNVRAFAADINARVASGSLPRIKALILNAGVQITTELQMTKNNYEIMMQVNYLANVVLVLLLLPSFAGVGNDSAGSKPSTAGRIIFISSDSHDPARGKGFPAPHWPSNAQEFSDVWHPKPDTSSTNLRSTGMGRYAMSKLFLAMFMFSLQKRLDSSTLYSNLTTLSIDPGWMATNILRTQGALARFVVVPFLKVGPYIGKYMGEVGKQMRTADTSAGHVVEFATGAWTNERPKAWFVINGEKGLAGETARDESKQETLWKETVETLGLTEETVPGLELKSLYS